MSEAAPPHSKPGEGLTERGKLHPLWLAIKTAVSLGLIVAVFWKLNLAAVWERSRQLPSAVVLVVMLMFAAQTYVASWRWWVILRHHNLGIRLLVALRICLIGSFFNQLLPSSIGGDVARAWYVYKGGSSKKLSLITVLSDRMYGMLALVCLAIVLFPVLVYSSIGSEGIDRGRCRRRGSLVGVDGGVLA